MYRDPEFAASSAAFGKYDKDGRTVSSSSAFAPLHCDWSERAISRLTAICHLPIGWDGHSGKPTDRDTAYFAAAILATMMHPSIPMPGILPLSYGGVQFEWH